MSVVSPPPNSTTPFVAPPTASSPPPLPSSPAPVSQPDALAPSETSPPPTPSPPASPPLPQSPPPTTPTPSPPASPPLPQSPPPPNVTLPLPASPPPSQPPMASPPPPVASPPPTLSPPPSSPPPPSSTPPVSSPPPPSSRPPASSPPPPENDPPMISPPPLPTPPPTSSPPPPTILPPALSPPPPLQNSVPPPAPQPPGNSSPPQSPEPPKLSPPPRKPPANSPPPPASKPPQNSPPPPIPDPHKSSPPSPASLPPSNSPPAVQLSPPPSFNDTQPSLAPPSPSVPPGGDITKTAGGGGIGTGGAVAIGIIGVLLLLGIIGAAGWCIWKRKKKDSGLNGGYVMPTSVVSSPKSDSALLKFHESTTVIGNGTGSNFVNSPGDPGGLGHSKTWFSYQELVEATNDFSVQNLLGVGGFGSVYKGCLADGRDVAVKQLNIGGGQGDREFRAEVEIISRIHHRHLVSLEGYCISGNRRLLVYDYVPNNTLYFHLHEQGKPAMDWATRVKIAIGAARGIAYLHEDCCPRIIHRDIKSSNILLDNNFEARVSDFGLAKLAEDAMTHVTTRVMGTFGYMAPEYASSGKLTEKSDVYSFGVVLLELISGRKPVDISQPLGEENLVEWSRPLISHALEKVEFDQLADPLLEKNYVDSEMFRMIEAAAACVRHSAAKRPRMGQIMRAFDGMAMSDLTNGMKVGESAIYNSAEQSAEIRLFRRMAFGSQESSNFFSQGTLNSRESGEHG